MKTPAALHDPATRHDAQTAPLMVAGVGASAGGLKALQSFVAAVPADSGIAFVVILHLDPERESRMGELLQDRAAIPVRQVDGPTEVEANRIYIIPPAHDLTIHGTTIGLRERGERSEHAPVDLFFRTLAEAYGPDAVGVVLSGTGADGTAGIRYIRQGGGITVAQSPDEAEYDGMPASAIASGLIDLVLPSARIPAELIRLRRQPPVSGDDTAGDGEGPGLPQVFATLRNRTGHDFSLYKRSTVLRRLERRLRFNGVGSLAEYVPVLQASSTESQMLLRDLLISVSSFFRDPETFEALAARVPSLFDGKGPADTVRVWVVGCATGEEVYSIAMLLAEYAGTLLDPPRLQLFATDIDEHGYVWARAGLYPAAAVASLSAERMRRWFTQEAGGYRIAKSLRELVLFAGHNVLHDPPFSRIDLISCRNLFIYLQPEAQERVLETFHFALNPDGTLFLGASESVGGSELFAPLDGASHRLFRRNTSAQRLMPRVAAADPLPRPDPAASIHRSAPAARSQQRFSYGPLHLRMLEAYAPASVIVDERLDVVHMSESAGRFLRLGEGQPNPSLLGLAGEELRRVLRTALHHAFGAGTPTSRRIGMKIDGRRRMVTVHVRPSVPDGATAGKFALVLFEIENAEPARAEDLIEVAARPAELELEDELRRTREQLEAVGEAHDRTVAELQTVNEELQSINEEQKAAAEELETGREEIQSINEELTTINQEYQSTIEELKRTNADLQNLIESTQIGTIFLDRAMRIRRFTPAVGALFNFAAGDPGRPFSDITHRLQYPDLAADVASVLASPESSERIEREVASDTGESYIVRINRYRSLEGGHDGVVLTFFENTAQHRVEEELREAKIAAESANLAKGNFLSTLSHEFRTPLTAIMGYAELLQLDGRLDAAQDHRVERIKTGSRHLAAMIEEILSFAKLDGGHLVIEDEPADARTLAREAGLLVEPAAAAKGLAFVLEVPEKPVPLVTDHAKARQILINLCGNAVKYTEAGEVRLVVCADGDNVRFEVRDTGVGIAAEHHDRIFERFWQVDGGSTRQAGGMGIGLAAAREYARLLGGDVTLESELGVGSSFRLTLPGTDGAVQ